jgi:biofilm PGA synthesis lipoprotein PgaB
VYDNDPAQTEKNLGKLIERVRKLGVNTVYLQAFADPDGDGNAEALYFPNRHLPMRADLFNRVAWQLKGRGGVKVYAWMPVLAFKTDKPEWLVKQLKGDAVVPTTHAYQRLSPFNDEARAFIKEIYEDLAIYSNFSGVIFHDDALMTDYEDMGPQALAYASRELGKVVTAKQLRTDPALRAKWGALKTNVITDFTKELAATLRYFQGDLKTARNIYAEVVLNPNSQEWFAQSYTNFLDSYDYTAIMAMPYMEKAKNPEQWLDKMIRVAMADPRAQQKTVFELQAVDWNSKQPIPSTTISNQLKQLQRAGVRQLGYYPDNYVKNHPKLELIKDVISLQTQAYLP